MQASSPPSPSSTGCCLSVNKVFNMHRHSLASPASNSTVSAAGLAGRVTGNLYTQLLITDKWGDTLALPAPGASCQPRSMPALEQPLGVLGAGGGPRAAGTEGTLRVVVAGGGLCSLQHRFPSWYISGCTGVMQAGRSVGLQGRTSSFSGSLGTCRVQENPGGRAGWITDLWN